MPSLSMRFARLVLAVIGTSFRDADKFRREILNRPSPSVAPVPGSLRRLATIAEQQVLGWRVFTVTPHARRSGWHIVYLHGGAWVNELVPAHWQIIKQLMRSTGATLTVPIYPLAPGYTYRDAYPFLAEVYRQVLALTSPEHIVLAGDSAGGGLAAGLALHARDLGLPLPGRLILFAPSLDLTFTNPEVDAIEPHDVMIARPGGRVAADWWAGGDDIRLPLLSPMYGDLGGLPPIDIFQGTEDVLLPDARLFRDKVQQAGGRVQLFEYSGAFHVFVGATFTPEARHAYRTVAEGLNSARDRL